MTENQERTPMEPDLIQYLLRKQETLGLNDAAFARMLEDLDLSTWMRYKNRERSATLRLVQIAARVWPSEHGAIWRAALVSRVRGAREPQTA